MARVTKRKKEFTKILPEIKALSLEDAVAKVSQFPKTKFDESVEMHFHLGIDTKDSEQTVRGTVVLPHGTGKKVRVAVFCKGDYVQKAERAGADHVGAEDLIEKVSKGFMDFDCIVATPDMMRDLSKLGKILGPRGLMPSPKAGTVTQDVEKVIKEVKAGRVEFKADKQAGVHVGIGKRSFGKEQILENARHLLEAINHVKPAGLKGNLIKSLSLSTTMGPGIRIAL
ncbi:MAG: 50S ribosomal protein L1 [Candidatus Omnitrophota bacterium]|nr:50S ribosomal protein L1 [Candidatus Omnitrophota bacterium]MDZ4242434.1 50S ribosomal protein L1 [Candidatus Omnitrophota bacterium]